MSKVKEVIFKYDSDDFELVIPREQMINYFVQFYMESMLTNKSSAEIFAEMFEGVISKADGE